jgi:hypothetical protein
MDPQLCEGNVNVAGPRLSGSTHKTYTVIPGRCSAPNPESRRRRGPHRSLNSGFTRRRVPQNDDSELDLPSDDAVDQGAAAVRGTCSVMSMIGAPVGVIW